MSNRFQRRSGATAPAASGPVETPTEMPSVPTNPAPVAAVSKPVRPTAPTPEPEDQGLQESETAGDAEPDGDEDESLTSEGAAFWHRWQVHPASSDPGSAWEKQDCHQCLPRPLTLLVEPGGSRFYCTACGRHGDANVDPPHYVGVRAPVGEIRWPTPDLDLDTVLTLQGFDPAETRACFPDMILVEAQFPADSGTPGWQPALRFDVRDEPSGVLRDYLFVALDAEGRMGASTRLPKGQLYPWGWDQITGDRVLFVDDPKDAIALRLSGQHHVACLPHVLNPARAGGGDWAPMTLMESRMGRINRVELAFTDDEAGHRIEDEISRRMGRDRTFRTRWVGSLVETGQVRSAYAVFLLGGMEAVCAELADISPYPIAGVHELDDVEEEYDQLYETGLLPGLLVGHPSLDQHYSVKLSQVTVLHGIPQHGKTTLLDEIIMQLAIRYGWGFGVFSAENSKLARHYAALTEKLVGKSFSVGTDGKRMSVEEKEKAKKFLKKHIRMIRPDEEKGNWSLDGILDLARSLVFRHGIRGLVIDPWNEIEHTRPAHLTPEEYLALQLSKVKRFAEVNGVHVWIVAHPKNMVKDNDGDYPVPTPYLISGGAMWNNKADFIIAVWRRRGLPDEVIMDIHIQKVRWKEDGRIGMTSLLYHSTFNRFTDQVIHDRRREALKNKSANSTKRVEVPLQDQLMSSPRQPTPLPDDLSQLYYHAEDAFLA